MDTKMLLVFLVFYVSVNSVLGQNCADVSSSCSGWPDSYCKQYPDYMKTNCPKKCGYCTGPTSAPDCKDIQSLSDCSAWKSYRYCAEGHRYHGYMKTNCKKTCGFCGTVTTARPTEPTKPTQPGSCSVSQKLKACSFNSDTCDFIDVPFDDDHDFEMMSSGGQDGEGYISSSGRGQAQMILPLELLVPHNGDLGNMCMEFYYRLGSGASLKVYEVTNDRRYAKTVKASLSGQQSSWKIERFNFRASQRQHLLIEATPKSGSVDIDSVRFCSGSC